MLRIFILGCAVSVGFLGIPHVGVSEGWAAPSKSFWTRKRVNGRWVKGHFPKNIRYAKLVESPRGGDIVVSIVYDFQKKIRTTLYKSGAKKIDSYSGSNPNPDNERYDALREALMKKADQMRKDN